MLLYGNVSNSTDIKFFFLLFVTTSICTGHPYILLHQQNFLPNFKRVEEFVSTDSILVNKSGDSHVRSLYVCIQVCF